MSNRSDNFNRANSTTALGSPSDGGAAWVAHSGTWGISSNAAYKVSTNSVWQLATLEASSQIVDVEATFATVGISGLVTRYTDESNYNFVLYYAAVNECKLFKAVAGTLTQIGNTSKPSVANGDVLWVSVDSDGLHSIRRNGTAILSGTITENTGTRHGFRTYNNSGRFDDFSIIDNAVSGAPTITALSARLITATSAQPRISYS